MLFGLFGGSDKKIARYAEILTENFMQFQNVQQALKLADNYGTEENMSLNNINKAKKKAVEMLIERKKGSINFTDNNLNDCIYLVNSINNMKQDDKNLLSHEFAEIYMVSCAENGVPYEFDRESSPLSIIYKANEKLYFCANAAMLKRKTRVNYSGLTGSVKICKGLRYRIGSLDVATKETGDLTVDDNGLFYITNLRLGYMGTKQFSVDLKKIVNLQIGEGGLYIFKQGRENPFIIKLVSYDAACAIVSHFINQE